MELNKEKWLEVCEYVKTAEPAQGSKAVIDWGHTTACIKATCCCGHLTTIDQRNDVYKDKANLLLFTCAGCGRYFFIKHTLQQPIQLPEKYISILDGLFAVQRIERMCEGEQ